MHRVKFDFQEELSLWTVAAGVGEADETLPITWPHHGPDEVPYTIWLHARQVIDILESFEGNKVSLHYTDTRRPLIFAPETGPYYSIVMPMVPPEPV